MMDGARSGLVRSSRDRMLLGVSGGLGDYFGVDPTLIRLVFVLLTVLLQGLGLLAYFGLALVMPPAGSRVERRLGRRGPARDADLRAVALHSWPNLPATPTETRTRRWRFVGTAFLLIGMFYLAATLNLLVLVRWDLVLSVAMIAVGVAIMVRQIGR